LALTDSTGYSVAGITFDGSSVYIGGGSDTVVDNSTVVDDKAFDLTGAGEVTYKGYSFSKINRVESTAKVTDNANTGNWTVDGNTIATGGSITFDGVSQVTTTQGVTNNTSVSQAVEMGASAIALAGITFTGSQSYTGSDGNKDTVTDSTNGAWSITSNRTLTDNTRNLSNVEQINTAGDITDNGNTVWSVDGKNLISSADQGITVSGTSKLTTEGNITDTTHQGWAVKGTNSAYSSENDLTVNGSRQIATTGSVTNDSDANQDVDLNTNSLVLAGMTFAGSKTYIGGASTIDTVTDNTVSAWDLTGNQALSNTTHNLSHVDQLNTSGDITDKNDGNWSVSGNKVASSTNYNVVIDGTGRIITEGSVTNGTDSDQTVTLGVSSLSFAGINFDGSTTYVGSTTQGTTDTIVDNNNSAWSLTGKNALRSSTHTLSNVDVVSTTAAITNVSGSTQTAEINGSQKVNVAGIQFEDVTAYTGGSDNTDIVSGTDLIWQLQGNNNSVAAADISMTNVGSIVANSADTDSENSQLRGISSNETYEVTGEAALTTKGMDITGIRMIYAGDGVDQIISNNSAEQWTLNGDNQIIAQGMTFHEIEQVNDLAANGTVKGSDGDDSITWTGNNTLSSYGVDFTGIKNIDTGAGNDTVYVDSALNSLNTLMGGDGEGDTLVNRTEGLSWELTSAASKLGGFAFSSFENLTHTLSTLDLATDSAVNLSVGSIGTPSAINKSISYTSPLDLLTLVTTSSVSGTTDVSNIDATAGGNINVTSTDTLTIDNAVSQSGDVAFTANSGDLNVNSIEANGGAGTATLTSNTGNIFAVAKETAEPHIIAKTTNFTALLQVGDQVNQFVIDSTTDGQVNIISTTFVSPIFTDATPEVVSVGDKLLSINEAVALSAFRTTSQQLADELGSVDPAIFTQLNNFNVAAESVATPLEGDFLLVENGLTSIQALPSDATAAGEEEEEVY
ncbi:beta strand repeat-containing protein, partial [Endozoicomonas numazuensis]|uniref:beta strand repeat-containing protein n=1 Tax=Endozoicomonas numazuensis TaxID=1137799 RepID=UPI00054E9C59